LDRYTQAWLDFVPAAEAVSLRKLTSGEFMFTSNNPYLGMGFYGNKFTRPIYDSLREAGVIQHEDPVYVLKQAQWCKLHGRPFPLNMVLAHLRKYYVQTFGEIELPKNFANIVWIGANFRDKPGYMLGIVPKSREQFKWVCDRGKSFFAPLQTEDRQDLTRLGLALGGFAQFRSNGKIETLCPPKKL
jgi:hypothetical protein